MLQIQDKLNQKINADWRNAGYNQRDAIMVEAVELFDHLNWKWWKTYEAGPDWGQVKMEAIDIWHFLMSEYLVGNNTSGKNLSASIQRHWPSIAKEPEEISVMNAVRSLISLASETDKPEDVDELIYCFGFLVADLGMSLDDIYRLYVGKAKLNELRWANDYGRTYIKDWNGQEDNQFLTELVASLDSDNKDFAQQIEDGLAAKYREIKG